jgi:hypothetical protein
MLLGRTFFWGNIAKHGSLLGASPRLM